MKENTLSYTTRIGKTTFIVNVKQSERAKKPLNTVFQEICRHEMLGDFSADNYLNLEKRVFILYPEPSVTSLSR